eukprot:sb/3471699/
MFKLVFICVLATAAAAVNLRGALESPGALAAAFKQHVAEQGVEYGVGESRLRMRMFRESPRADYLASAESVDWRESGAVTGVKSQGDCGSCYTFAAIGSLEGAYKVKTGKLIDLSEQELLDCTYEKMYDDYNGCDGGFYDDCWEYIGRSGHLSSSADYSYNGVCNKCNAGAAANALVDG